MLGSIGEYHRESMPAKFDDDFRSEDFVTIPHNTPLTDLIDPIVDYAEGGSAALIANSNNHRVGKQKKAAPTLKSGQNIRRDFLWRESLLIDGYEEDDGEDDEEDEDKKDKNKEDEDDEDQEDKDEDKNYEDGLPV
ncbi:MAG: hypothetical protein Q9213_001164 [Squamulea squamosa]